MKKVRKGKKKNRYDKTKVIFKCKNDTCGHTHRQRCYLEILRDLELRD